MKKRNLYTLAIILIAFVSFYILVLKNQLQLMVWWELVLYMSTMLVLILYLVRLKNER